MIIIELSEQRLVFPILVLVLFSTLWLSFLSSEAVGRKNFQILIAFEPAEAVGLGKGKWICWSLLDDRFNLILVSNGIGIVSWYEAIPCNHPSMNLGKYHENQKIDFRMLFRRGGRTGWKLFSLLICNGYRLHFLCGAILHFVQKKRQVFPEK